MLAGTAQHNHSTSRRNDRETQIITINTALKKAKCKANV